MTYGVTPAGFVRKPLNIILAEIEAANITEFGPDLIQTPQSPMGQINGLMADIIAQGWEIGEASYHARDPDQAEGVHLDMLARIRLLLRGEGESDESLRQAITNQGRARVDTQDIVRAIIGIPGVTYAQLFINETSQVDPDTLMQPGQVALAVLGGDDADIAAAIRTYAVPGVSFHGNTYVTSVIDGYCRSTAIIRPTLVPTKLTITVRTKKDIMDCPAPSVMAIRDGLLLDWAGDRLLKNGDDIDFFRVRSPIESRYPNVEVVSFVGERDGIVSPANIAVTYGFFEMASFDPSDVIVSAI
jgi:hypothetical protein